MSTEPIRLLSPSVDSWARSRAQATDPNKPIEVVFRLSDQKPDPIWVQAFCRVFKFRCLPLTLPRIHGQSVVVNCLPGQVMAYRAILQTAIAEANEIASPIMAYEEMPGKISDARNEELRKRSCGDHSVRTAHLIELAQTALDGAMTQMLEDEVARFQGGDN